MRTMVGVGAILATLICLGGARAADDEPPCQRDVQRLCALVPTEGNYIRDCLQSHGDQLSGRCRKHVEGYTRATEKLHAACRQDLARLCGNLEHGKQGGYLDACLLQHRDKLSDKCRETLDANSRPEASSQPDAGAPLDADSEADADSN